MDQTTAFDRLESGESLRAGMFPKDRTGLGEAYFSRLLSHYGVDNEKLSRLGRHWRRLGKLASDPAWVYRAGGVYERSQGRWLASANAFLAAGVAATDPVAKYSFAVGAIDSLARAGKLAEAEKQANRLARGLRREGEPGLAARALLNLGNALLYQDRMIQARRALSRALPDLDAAGLQLEAASARLALSSTHLFGGDPRVAVDLAQQVKTAADGLGAEYLGDLAGLNLALALTVTGAPDQAHRLLLDLGPRMESSPFDQQRVKEYMADVLFRLNLWAEATEAYQEVLRGTGRPPLHQANIALGLGQSMAAQGRHEDAQAHFVRASRIYGRINNSAWQAVSIHERALSKIDSHEISGAKRLLTMAEAMASESPFHLTQIWLTQTRLGVDRLEQAAKSIRKYGYMDLEWQVHFLRAERASGSRSLPHYRRMFQSIIAGRLAIRSVSGRLGFLKDKTEALRRYVATLLDNPTEARVEEVVATVRQIRSVTLIDEIMRDGEIPASVREQLWAARAALENSTDVTLPGGTRRAQNSANVGRAQRLATTALLELDLVTQPTATETNSGVIVTENAGGMNVIIGNRLHRLATTEESLRRTLRWLSFEMAAPMADRNAGAKPANDLLHQLAEIFHPIWESGADWVCPDAITWRVPWALCSTHSAVPKVWELAMHPGMTNRYERRLSKEDSALIWLGNSADLPFAQKEAEAIAAKFNRARIVSSQAEARESLAGNYEIVHVVSHAIHRPNNPMLSSIQFPDGPVFAYEIAQSPLHVNLATLSACDSGTLSLATRSEPDGLARAFIARGAASVVASQWPLDDEGGFIQFCAIYSELMENRDLRDAIFNAQCICRQWRMHPYYWGALALYSGYRSPQN